MKSIKVKMNKQGPAPCTSAGQAYKMSVEEENEVNSVGSMPPLTVRSNVEALDESSNVSTSGKNIDKISEETHDKGHEGERKQFNDVFDVWICEWTDDFSVDSKIRSMRRKTSLVK